MAQATQEKKSDNKKDKNHCDPTTEQHAANKAGAQKRKSKRIGRFNNSGANLLDEMAEMRLDKAIAAAMADTKITSLREGSLMANAAETWFGSFRAVRQGRGNFQRATEQAKKDFVYNSYPVRMQRSIDKAFKLAGDALKHQLFDKPAPSVSEPVKREPCASFYSSLSKVTGRGLVSA